MSSSGADARSWLAQQRAAAIALAELNDRELRDLSDAEALRMTEAVLSATPIATMNDGRRSTSGLVEQQRLFARARR